MLGGEVVEGEQRLAILDQALGGLVVFQLRSSRGRRRRRRRHPSASPPSRSPAEARLALGCWLFGSLFSTFAVLCTQQRCSRVVGHTSPSAFQKPSAPSATASSGATAKPSPLQIEQQLAPVLRALARAVGEADQLLPALRRRADQHEDALLLVLQPRLQIDAVGPDVDVAPGRQIALASSACARRSRPPSAAQIVEADRPGASLPSKAASASSKSPVEMPFR